MIFADTSVWVGYLRGHDATLVQRMNAVPDAEEVALAAPVRIEILSAASRRDLPRLRSLLGVFEPTAGTWRLIDDWLERAARANQHFGAMNVLAAALAAEQQQPGWSLDRGFERMAHLGLGERYLPAS